MVKKKDKRILSLKEWKSPIPRKIHLIWIGGEPPDYFKHFLNSFQKNLPEFEIRVWGNKELNKKHFPITMPYIKKAQKLQGKKIKASSDATHDDRMHSMLNTKGENYTYSKWAQITDLMRLEIVFREGGYYFDTTFEILKPMYKLFNMPKVKFVGCNEVPRFKDFHILSNSFFGAIKGSPILKRLLNKRTLDQIDFYSTAVDFETGPGFLRSVVKTTDPIKIFPSKYFYPFVEEYTPGQDPPYRKSSKNKCHSFKKKKGGKTKKQTKRQTNRNKKNSSRVIRLKNKKGYLEIPCKKYPNSYALKHWQLGKSWLISNYYLRD